MASQTIWFGNVLKCAVALSAVMAHPLAARFGGGGHVRVLGCAHCTNGYLLAKKRMPQRIRPLLEGKIVLVGTHWHNHARLSCGGFNGRLARCEMWEGMSTLSVGLDARLCLASARCPTGTSTSEGARSGISNRNLLYRCCGYTRVWRSTV